uniref:Uncharacterized protein n=1 Tax=Candidatus Kentrum sp. FW TaxID=2126338 RepID=A0A450SHR6_9GAMM|nr:MAG: hypothetical protein BECKFW1821B_GA0114236_101313 [Candidatus Kentron sp. FW]VFJ56924.1 MAG: hypothetical protein BECKFW1821A_GA0114235_106514 [Candidatus Kentron sp. FW]
MNMTILVRWFTWVWLRWKYQFGMSGRVSRDVVALSSGGNNSYSGDWITPSEEGICRDFDQLEDSNVDYFRWITVAILWLAVAFFWLIFRITDIAPQFIAFFLPKTLQYLDIIMGIVGGLGITILITILFAANESLPLRVTGEEAAEAVENLRCSGEAGRHPTPVWQRLLLLFIVAFEAGIFGSLVLSYVGDFTTTQNLIAGFGFGTILAIVLTMLTHKAGKTIYIAHHRAALTEVVDQEVRQSVKMEPSYNGLEMERSETFCKIKEAFGPIQFNGERLSFWKAWGIPILTLILVAALAVAGFFVRDNIQRNIIDLLKRQQTEETTLREELSLLDKETIAPQEIMGEQGAIVPQDILGEIESAETYRADSFAANEMMAARAGIFIIALTFVGLQIITTIIGYHDGFDFGVNTITYYPRLQAYEKSSRRLTGDVLEGRDRKRLKVLDRRVDSILAKYHKSILQRTARKTRMASLHMALESRQALRFETYRERYHNANPY